MSGFEILGTAAAILQLAQFVEQVVVYIKKYIGAGKDYNNRLGNLNVDFELFHESLITIKSVADAIEESKDKRRHQREIRLIRENVTQCRKTLLKMLDCSRKYQNNKEGRPVFKLAVDYWCFEQNGKILIDDWRRELNDRLNHIDRILQASTLKQLLAMSGQVSDIHADDPPPLYTDERNEWDLGDFKNQDFTFDSSKISKAFIAAIASGECYPVKLLLKTGESPLAVNEDKWCALHYAVRADNKQIMKALLAAKQIQGVIGAIDQRDKNGDTALHLAAYLGKKNMVRELLKQRASVNAMNRHQQSSLFKAVERNHKKMVDIIEILEEHGAVFLPLRPATECTVSRRFNEVKSAMNHRKANAGQARV